MSDSNRVSLAFVEEVTAGTTPAANLQTLRYTSESLTHNTTNVTSDEVRSDRMIADIIRTQIDASGDISFEGSYDTFENIGWEGALHDDFTAFSIAAATDISVNGSNQFVDDGAAGQFTGLVVGQWVKTEGFSNSANNGVFPITAVDGSGNNITISTEFALVVEAAGASVNVDGNTICNGVTPHFFTIERAYNDITEFVQFLGMHVNTLTMNIAAGAILNGTMSFQGLNATRSTTSVGTGFDAETTTDVWNAIDNVTGCFEGINSGEPYSTLTEDLISASFTITNNTRPQPAVKNLGLIGIGLGSVNVSGAMSVYLTSAAQQAQFERYLNFTETNIAFIVTDTDGNQVVFSFPSVKFTAADEASGGRDQDVTLDLTWEARRDADSDCMVRIDKFDA